MDFQVLFRRHLTKSVFITKDKKYSCVERVEIFAHIHRCFFFFSATNLKLPAPKTEGIISFSYSFHASSQLFIHSSETEKTTVCYLDLDSFSLKIFFSQ